MRFILTLWLVAFKFQNMIFGLIFSEEFGDGIHFIPGQKYPFKGKKKKKGAESVAATH